MKIKFGLISFVTFFLVLSLFWGGNALAYVAASTNYRLEADSVNFGGGESADSASFSLSDTGGEIGTGTSTSNAYNLHAGYRAMSESVVEYITLSTPADVPLGSISATDGGTSSGSASWTVVTNNANGYQLEIKADNSPALKYETSGFSDYDVSGGVPGYTWAVSPGAAVFGFTPEGDDIADRYLDDGTTCGTGAGETADSCWDGLSTSNRVIAERGSSNLSAGSTIAVKFRAAIGAGGKDMPKGDYSARIIMTATTL